MGSTPGGQPEHPNSRREERPRGREGHYGMVFMPGTCRRTTDDIGRIVTALEQKLLQYPGEEDLADGETWL